MNPGPKASCSVRADNVGASTDTVNRHTNSDLPPPPAAPLLMSSAPSPSPSPPAQSNPAQDLEKDTDKEKDKSSLSTTLNGTNNTKTTKRNMNTSENAPSTSSHTGDLEKAAAAGAAGNSKTNGNSKGQSSKNGAGAKAKKPGFMARIVRMLVPCAGPSAAHSVELPHSPTGSADALREKPAVGSTQEQAAAVPGPSQPAPNVPVAPQITPSPSQGSQVQDASDLPLAQQSPITLAISPEGETALIPSNSQLLPEEETEGVTSGAVQAPGSTGEEVAGGTPHHTVHVHHTGTSDGTGDEEYEDAEASSGGEADVEDEEDRLIRQGGAGIPVGPDGKPKPLLPPIAPHHAGRKCLVLDLDETLVHSSFKVRFHSFPLPFICGG